jgi:hypothetical protein
MRSAECGVWNIASRFARKNRNVAFFIFIRDAVCEHRVTKKNNSGLSRPKFFVVVVVA